MALGAWPAMADDDGSTQFGTIVNKTLFDSIKASIEASVFSGTNPALSPAQIIDEIVTARGVMANLNARLSVSLNTDGSLITPAGLATTAQIQKQLGNDNVIPNSEFRYWANGLTSAPDGYTATLAGGSSITRAGIGEPDTTNFGTGEYTAKLGKSAGTCKLVNSVYPSSDFSSFLNIKTQTRKFSVGVRGISSAASSLRVVVDDGVTQTASSFHTGGGTEEFLSVTHTVSSTASKLDVYVEVLQAGANYVGGFVGIFSDITPTDWNPPNNLKPGLIYVNSGSVANALAAETDLYSWVGLANMLNQDSQGLRITAYGTLAANANAKTIRFYFGGTGNSVITGTVINVAGNVWRVVIDLIRSSSAGQRMVTSAVAGVGATTYIENKIINLSKTWASLNAIKFTGQATANSDITIEGAYIELLNRW